MLEQCLHTKGGLIGTNANVIGDEVLHTEHTTPDAYEPVSYTHLDVYKRQHLR